MVRKMTEDEAYAFSEERCKFLSYKDISEYIEDIVTILVYSTWHFTEDRAREQCEDRKALIESCFKKKVPADDCAMDVGYGCG